MPDDVYQRGNQPLHITISFDYLVNVDGEAADPESLKQNLAFRLGYDNAEIPFSEKILASLKSEISEVLPQNVMINRVGGELTLDGEKIKKF